MTTSTFMTQQSPPVFLTVRTNNTHIRATRGVISIEFWNFSVALAGGGDILPFLDKGVGGGGG